MRRIHADVHWEALGAMVDGLPQPLCELSPKRRLLLYGRLSRARVTFDLWKACYEESTTKAMAKRLGEIENSLKIIAGFWKDMPRDKKSSDAFAVLMQAGERWAAVKPLNELPAGFDPSPFQCDGVQVMDYGAASFLNRFFEGASSAREIVLKAIDDLGEGRGGRHDWFKEPAERWLIGTKLPSIYRTTFGNDLKISDWPEASKTDHPGNAFSLGALRVMRVYPKGDDDLDWPLSTLKSHIELAGSTGERRAKKVPRSP